MVDERERLGLGRGRYRIHEQQVAVPREREGKQRLVRGREMVAKERAASKWDICCGFECLECSSPTYRLDWQPNDACNGQGPTTLPQRTHYPYGNPLSP